MQYTRLGRAGAKVSRLALGTMNFGPVIDEAASTAILDRAVEAGVDFIDTADVYGGGMWGDHPGQSEEILGRWMRDRGNRDEAHRPRVQRYLGTGTPEVRRPHQLHRRGGDRVVALRLVHVAPGPTAGRGPHGRDDRTVRTDHLRHVEVRGIVPAEGEHRQRARPGSRDPPGREHG